MSTTFSSPFAASFNPFLPSSEVEVEEESTGREVAYALVPTGPAVASEEVESYEDVVEVRVRWGTQVLALRHLDAANGFSIGEGGDFEIEQVAKHALVERRGTSAVVHVPADAMATLSVEGEHPRPASGEVALAEGMSLTIELAMVTIEVSSVRAGKKLPVGFLAALASGAAACIGLSFVGHAAMLASLAMFMPKMAADDAETISREQLVSMRALMDASADRESERLKDEKLDGQESTGGGSVGGEAHKGEEGAAGTTKAVTTQGHMAFKGADDRARLSRKEELELAANWGTIGLLRSGVAATGPNSPWATESQLGQDEADKWGALYGRDANDMMGYGLGLSSTGAGGGGNGVGIGLNGIGDLVGGGGNGPGKWGIGKGDRDGMGIGHGPGSGAHVAKAPRMTPVDIQTGGHLPAEVIQRIVRQNFGRFRLCYEAGLRANPSLSGRVVTKFVIGRDGAVSQAMDGGSDIANQEVIGCVVRSFNALSFPAPDNGIATVIYPISLSPGE